MGKYENIYKQRRKPWAEIDATLRLLAMALQVAHQRGHTVAVTRVDSFWQSLN